MITLMVILFFLLLVVIVGAILNSISSILGVIFVICIGIFIFLMIIGLIISFIINFFTATKEERRAYEVKREVKKLRRKGRKAEARLIEQNEMLLNSCLYHYRTVFKRFRCLD